MPSECPNACRRCFACDQEIERLRADLSWLLRHTSGKELRRMVGELSDTSNLDEFISAIERARSR
jgi:hypothetical protein